MESSNYAVKIKPRYAWVDTAKGISIVLVVVLHASLWLEFIGLTSPWIDEFNRVFVSVRMPLFFCMAGLFSSKWVAASWRSVYSGRLALLIWVLILWQPIVFGYKVLAAKTLPGQEDGSLLAQIFRVVVSGVRPNGELWFLWALIIFVIAAKATRGMNPKLQLSLAAAVSCIWLGFSSAVLDPSLLRLIGDGWSGALSYYVFFLGGLYLRSTVTRFGNSLGWRTALALVAAYACYAGIIEVLDWHSAPVVSFVSRLGGLAAGIALAVLTQRIRPLVFIGQNTLPIYLAHSAIIVTFVAILPAAWRGDSHLGNWLPIALSAIALGISLALYSLRSRVRPLRLLYEVPRWFTVLPEPHGKRITDSPDVNVSVPRAP
jgi:uncharacterized membrane protein YcfT